MRLSIITPTADQPRGMHLLEQYVARQSMQPHEWIVADDGLAPAVLHAGQTHLMRKRSAEGGRSLAGNMLAALEQVTGDAVVVMEHDDWYRADHLEVCANQLRHCDAVGATTIRYYNVASRCWRLMGNAGGSALCNTAFRSSLIPRMRAACERVMASGSIGLDRFFWQGLPSPIASDGETVVGIKGLPGRSGLGVGHRPGDGWNADPELSLLRVWLGDDVDHYRLEAR